MNDAENLWCRRIWVWRFRALQNILNFWNHMAFFNGSFCTPDCLAPSSASILLASVELQRKRSYFVVVSRCWDLLVVASHCFLSEWPRERTFMSSCSGTKLAFLKSCQLGHFRANFKEASVYLFKETNWRISKMPLLKDGLNLRRQGQET